MARLGKESQEPTRGAAGLRAGRFVWRSPPQPKGGLNCAQVPMERGEVERRPYRGNHTPERPAEVHTHVNAHARERTRTEAAGRNSRRRGEYLLQVTGETTSICCISKRCVGIMLNEQQSDEKKMLYNKVVLVDDSVFLLGFK